MPEFIRYFVYKLRGLNPRPPFPCIFRYHDIRPGYQEVWEPDYCARCHRTNDEIDFYNTIPDRLERAYGNFMIKMPAPIYRAVGQYIHNWLLERGWEWVKI